MSHRSNEESNLYIGKVTKDRIRKVDGLMRLYVGDLIKDGSTVLFMKIGNSVYIFNSDNILGTGLVSDKRVYLNKDVAKTLNLSEGEYTAIETVDEVDHKLKTNLRLVKVEFKVAEGLRGEGDGKG